jgi:hypothetical protein
MRHTKRPYEILLEVAAEQRRSLEEPCLHLDCSLLELEQRLDRLDPEALRVVEIWLGAGWRRRQVK